MRARSCTLLLALLLAACRQGGPAPAPAPSAPPAAASSPSEPPGPGAPAPVAAAPAPAPAPDASTPAAAAPFGHVPPIDCPLRRAGVDRSRLQPFEQTEAYIAFLERPDRAAWQKPEDVVTALGLRGDETVADFGAGSGYFTFRLARALPAGRVRAIDIQPEMVRHLHHRALEERARNVEVRLSTETDPQISGDEDLVFLCDVLHHAPDRAALVGRLFGAMKPGARLVLVEFREGDLPEGPPESVKIPRAALVGLALTAGFGLPEEHPDLLPYQHLLVFRKPE